MLHLSNNAYVDQLCPDRRTKSEVGPTFAFPRSIRTFGSATPSTSFAVPLAMATGWLASRFWNRANRPGRRNRLTRNPSPGLLRRPPSPHGSPRRGGRDEEFMVLSHGLSASHISAGHRGAGAADAISSPKRASYPSPGQRPGCRSPFPCLRALKKRKRTLARRPMSPRWRGDLYHAPSGLANRE
jgi:hypothetical protein